MLTYIGEASGVPGKLALFTEMQIYLYTFEIQIYVVLNPSLCLSKQGNFLKYLFYINGFPTQMDLV